MQSGCSIRRRHFHNYAGIISLAALLLVGAVAHILADISGKAPGAPAVSVHEIPNFHIVYPALWRGAAPTEAGLRALKAQGVRTVIDLRISPKRVAAERRFVEGLGLKFINLPMSGDPPTTKQIETFLHVATSADRQPVFIHCQHGADRTGTLIGIYRERIDGWSFDRAYAEMRRYGFDPRWRKLTATVRRYAPAPRVR